MEPFWRARRTRLDPIRRRSPNGWSIGRFTLPTARFSHNGNAAGAWQRLTYGAALATVRPIAQALLDRRLSASRPLLILSGNSIEHGLLALAAMYAGVPYAPVAPSYSLLAREFTTLRAIWTSLNPGMVFAADGALFERALTSVRRPGRLRS